MSELKNILKPKTRNDVMKHLHNKTNAVKQIFLLKFDIMKDPSHDIFYYIKRLKDFNDVNMNIETRKMNEIVINSGVINFINNKIYDIIMEDQYHHCTLSVINFLYPEKTYTHIYAEKTYTHI